MSEYHGYWFWDLENDKITQAKDSIDEYCLLNCPQSVVGPFKTEANVNLYKATHPDESKKFNEMLKDMEEFLYGEYH
jgi:uncharacterized protein YutD